ncbi:dipeptide/oligopeptide/nickel ABC transporter permease/ATP-binding protein [Nonomuraea endophytica]|uniref:Oligopeptide/dipeptide ABC transporter ATP-binding protein n=1 Tax=Nonomuraea endophytica TaxID=714136 RepID=A0A7W8A8D3_9ACTN|nr:dipeptide/oligopeptide/nickel ABC transporter permease/ATP-binding protein [Nonomuraea endophytica]MBB5081502.1 oligopeptide/dipeptide ABC transporter ATP-binding protein [Nonomuraea endophytica]
MAIAIWQAVREWRPMRGSVGEPRGRGQGGIRWRRGVVKTPTGAAGLVMVTALLVLSVAGPVFWSGAARAMNTEAIMLGSSSAHPLGTDALGRDILARLLVATRLSALTAVGSVAVGALAGIALGSLPAMLGRRAARATAALIELLLAFPPLLLMIFLGLVTGGGTGGAVIAFAGAMAPSFARLTQTLTLSVTRSDYVASARMLGVSRPRLVVRHVLPNIAEPLLVNLSIAVGMAFMAISGLSFLGMGVRSPDYDWGQLLNEGLTRIYDTPAAALGPGVAIVFAGVAFQLLGEGAIGAQADRRPARPDDPAPILASKPSVAGGDRGSATVRAENLQVSFPAAEGVLTPVRGVNLTVAPGEILGIVGESGCGKTLTGLALTGLVPEPGVVRATRLEVLGQDPRGLSPRQARALLGRHTAMVFQNPGTAMNPVLRVGSQLAETAVVHHGMSRRAAGARAVDRLRAAAVPAPERRARQFPHQLSGGTQQRAVIAMGLMGEARLLIADEPTTALDVTVQRQVLALLRDVNSTTGASIVLVSHDIAVVAETCHRVVVMYAGLVVEDLPVDVLRSGPAHPYTRALLACALDMTGVRDRRLPTIPGRPPGPGERFPGCPFVSRCGHAGERCATEPPAMEELGRGHRVACWHPRTGAP